MQTVDKKMMALVQRLARVSRARKECERIEKELKEDIRLFMKDEKLLEAGLFSVVVQTRTRTGIDLDRLRFSFSREILKTYEKTTTYEVMEVLVNTIDVNVLMALEFKI